MPSPFLHSFASVALVRFVRDAPSRPRLRFVVPAALIFAGNAPDLDFVAGILIGAATRFHRGASHSLVVAVLFGFAAFLLARWMGYRSARRFGVLMCLAFTSHIVLDMLSPLFDPPRGVQLGWPFVTERFSFPFRIFLGVRFDPRSRGFVEGLIYQPRNFYVIASEIILVSVIWGVTKLARSSSLRGA